MATVEARTPSESRRALRFLLEHLPWLLSALLLTATVALVPAFRRVVFWEHLCQQYFAPALLALALTPVILTGGIDLSVGSVTVFASVVGGVLMRDAGWPVAAALAAAALAGALAGLINGALVVLGVVPLVATLATRELFRGLALSLGGTNAVTDLPAALGDIWHTPVLGLPLPLVLVVALFVLTWLVVHHTWVGRMLFAVGDNEQAARFAGVPVRRLKLSLYTTVGLVAGLCGACLLMRYGSAKATAEKTLELTAITCVILGGVRITGGAGHVAGTLLGTLTVVTLLAAMTSVPPTGRDVVLGVLLLAVAGSNEAARRGARRLG
jgi:ribose/xylose/arabinose/galactoside ABC-type transport system permease subunit